MRAIVFDEHSASSEAYHQIEDLPVPVLQEDEVLVRVAYAALNRLDHFVRLGWKGLRIVFPHVPCSDFSGTIVEIGSDVRGWQCGQPVTADPLIACGSCRACLRGEQNRCRTAHLLGEHVRGACAEFVAVPARNLIAIPPEYDMKIAAAASLVYVTAWHNLVVAGELRPGEHVLVVGAGGGVNSASIQIARLAGATVLVVASNAGKAQRARELGADWVHDRSLDPDWPAAVFVATKREGVDMVVDNVGQATWSSSLRSLRPGGRLVTVGGTSGYQAQVPVNLIFGRHLSIIGSTMGTHDDYQTVMQLVFQHKLHPVVDTVFPMEQFQAAMARMLAGEMFGKILIEVNPSP